jgi:hypothetical protein
MEAEQNAQESRGTSDESEVLQEVTPTLSDHVQDVLRGIMNFIRGREASEPEHDHER